MMDFELSYRDTRIFGLIMVSDTAFERFANRFECTWRNT